MVDFTIRGAGIIGLMMAWTLVQRGQKVQIIDPNGPGAGASGGIVGALAPHMPEKWSVKKQFQLDSLRLLDRLWPEIDAVSGLSSGYGRIGRLMPILNDRGLDLAQARAQWAIDLWRDYATWNIVDTAPDWVPPTPTGRWVYDTLSARINPAAACASIARALASKGCAILSDAPDRGRVIWATGVHDLIRISDGLGMFYGAGEKGQGAILDINLGAAPQLYFDNIHVIPHANGMTAIGSTTERFYENGTQTDALLDDLLERARTLIPALRDAPVLTRWANERPRSHSRAPIIGHHPIEPDAYILNGGFKIGLAMAPKMADCLADFILTGADTIPNDFNSKQVTP
jgi:glycine oxidase